MCLGLGAVFTNSFEQLARIFVLGRWPFITLAVATVFVLPRRRPELAPLVRAWGYPWVPAAFVLFSLAMLGSEIARRPADLLPSLGIATVGVLVYFGSRAWITWRAAAAGSVATQPAP
jgi:APA family basic amino acid/polyamine antiporter